MFLSIKIFCHKDYTFVLFIYICNHDKDLLYN